MSRAVSGGKHDPPCTIPGEEDLDWIVPVSAAVLALSPFTHRNLKKRCKKCTVKQDGHAVEKLYVRLQENKAVDLGWLGANLPQHLLSTLVSERVPLEAKNLQASRSPAHAGGRWTTYITMITNTMLMMGQLGQDFSLAAQRVLGPHENGPNAFVDGVFLALAVGLASCFPKREEGYGSDDMEEEEGRGGGREEAKREPMALEDSVASNGNSAKTGEDSRAALDGVKKEETSGEIVARVNGEDAKKTAPTEAAKKEEEEEEEEEDEEEDGGKGREAGVHASTWGPVDLVGSVIHILALYLRNEYKSSSAPKGKGRGRDSEAGGSDADDLRLLRMLARHDKVRPALVDGLFDAIGTFFDAMDHSSERQNKQLVSYIGNAIEVLYFCSWDQDYVSELVVSDCMHQGRAFSMLKKVLLMEQEGVVSNMLRWLLVFSEYEDPPTQDILAGYQLDSRLLHSIIERNNAAMVAWGARQPYNSLACDLLKAVEIFADDSNFKAQVIDSSADALALVLRRGAEYNGFGKADSMHLSFTYAFFKLLAALQCFNAKLMPPEAEKHFVTALAAECRTKEHRDGVRASLEFLLTLPDVIKKAKDNTCEPVLDEDLALVAELLSDFNRHCEPGGANLKPSAPKSGGSAAKRGKAHEKEEAKPKAASAKARSNSASGSGSAGPATGSGGASSGAGRGRKRARNGEMWMTEEEQMRLAIQASLQEQ